jgi:hypothetical protein
VEHLERRELLSNDVPTIVAVLPADGSTVNNSQPSLVVTFSENVQTTQAINPANYLLFNQRGSPISIDHASYSSNNGNGPFQVTLGYNGDLALPADSYTLFVRGDQIHDVDDNFALARPGQIVVANSGNRNVSLVNTPGDGTLQALTNTPSAATPTAVRIADINGDGIPDLIVVNSGSDTVNVFDGLATGGFAASPSESLTLPSGATAQALVVADLNQDNSPDIAVADKGTNDVTVFLNQGDGTFGAGLQYAAAKQPVDLVAGDFNQDGHIDLAVAGSEDSFFGSVPVVSVLLADATPSNRGKFLAPVTFRIAFTARALAAADLNLDGKLDLAVAGDGGVQTLYNTSSGGVLNFSINTPLATTPTNGLAVGDVDLDPSAGPDILATSTSNGGEVLVFPNSNGVFNSANEVDFPIGAAPTSITLADVNGDGLNDILLTTTKGSVSSLAVLLNQSIPLTPFFSAPVFSTVDSNPVALAAHLNAGGVVDEVATVNSTGNDVSVLQAKGDGSFVVSTEIALTGGGTPSTVAVGDLNGDHVPDIVTANISPSGSDTVTILLSQPGGGYGAPVSVTVGSDASQVPLSLVLGDFTGNGLLDIAVTNPSDNSVTVVMNNGNGTFSALTPFTVGASPVALVAADFNEDGKLDLAVAENGLAPQFPAPGVLLFLGNGDGTFQTPTQILSNVTVAAMAAADLNDDGHTDIAAVDNKPVGSLYVLRGDGAGKFTALPPTAAGPNPTALAVVDMNRDGFPDIVVLNHTDPDNGLMTDSVSLLLNNAIPRAGNAFNAPIKTDVIENTAAQLRSVTITQVNQDLFPDLVLTTSGGPNNVLTLPSIDGRGKFGSPQFYAVAGGSAAAPSIGTVLSDPLLRATSFTVTGNFVTSNLIENGSFEATDLNQESGNLIGWQTFLQEGSRGQWQQQTGNFAPMSSLPVVAVPRAPDGQFAAMLDQPNLVRLDGNPVDYSGVPPAKKSDYSGTHILYQDFLIPTGATKVTLSFDLFINSSAAFSDPNTTPALDYFPGIPNAPQNQQVRVDIMDPNADLRAVGAGVLQNVFITTPGMVFSGYRTFTADLTALAGKLVRLRFAEVNNQGKMIVGVDGVQVSAFYPEATPPSLNGVRLRNPGFGATSSFGGNTTDPTIIGQVGDIGSPSNIAFVEIDPNNDGFNGPDDYRISAATNAIDALGNFVTTLPALLPDGHSLLPGPRTVAIRAVNRAGLQFVTTLTFNLQGPSLTGWQAKGPGPIEVSADFNPHGQGTISGRITSIAVDPRDASGSTIYAGSDNGGVWKTTDGGANWTPLTDFIVDPTLGNVPASIGSLAIDPSSPNTIYAATGVADNALGSHPGIGILKSIDGGQTWTVVGKSVFAGARVSKLVVSSHGKDNTTRLYAAVASGGQFGPGVYRSTDSGATWKNVLTPSVMFLDKGGTVAAGTALASVTDIAIDTLSQDGTEENLWIGLGNTGLLPVSSTAGVWFSANHGDTWQQIVGGHDQKNNFAVVPNQTIPPNSNTAATGIGRITIGLPTGRTGDEGIVYVMIATPGNGDQISDGNSFNPKGTSLGSSDIGIYKTRNGGLSWTHVMLKELTLVNKTFLYMNLFTLGHEASDIGSLIVDPNNANVFYLGGSARFLRTGDPPPFHSFLRVDTSNMRDTSYFSPYYPNSTDPVYPNDGDDISKAGDAARNVTAGGVASEPGSYPKNPFNLGGYQGEGVFWYDLQTTDQGQGGTPFDHLPDAITSLAFDPQGRLLVGTVAGIWRGVTQGFAYDTTSGGVGIDAFKGVRAPRSAGMSFTDLNGNLQIADTTSVAIDPKDPNVLDNSQRETGWARTTGGLAWIATNGGSIPNQFAGPVRTGVRDPNAPPGTPTVVYRAFAPLNLDSQFLEENLVQISLSGGDQGSFVGDVGGLNTGDVVPRRYVPLAINPVGHRDQNGILQDELLFWTNKINETDNGGGNWDPASSITNAGQASALAFGPSGKDVFYFGTLTGKLFVDQNDGAQGFPERDAGLPGTAINGITVDPTNPLIAYAMVDGLGTKTGHVFRTTNGGVSWTNITNNLQDVPAYSMAIDPRPSSTAPNGTLYVGTFTGVYLSIDTGKTWQRLGVVKNPDGTTTFSLPNVAVRDVELSQDFEKLDVATEGRGVFEISIDRFGPRIISLNPSSPSTPLISSFTVTFDKAVDPRTLTTAQVQIVGPSGAIPAMDIKDLDPAHHNVYTVDFAPQFSDGTYTLTIGPGIRDFIGNLMDQNGNGINGEPGDVFTGFLALNTADNGHFISGIYNDLLHRPADSAGFLNFLGLVDPTRFQFLRQVATAFVTSPEARSLTITDLYNSLLGRPPSSSELSHWLDALAAGTTPEQVLTTITSSPEYFARAGSTDVGFLNHLFQDVLIRKVDAGTLSGFLVQAEVNPRTAIVNTLDGSPEYQANLVQSDFSKLLNRPASGAELSAWVGQFQHGSTDEQIAAAIIGSPEYSQKKGVSNSDWLSAAFNDILGRAPDSAEQAMFGQQLANSTTREAVALELLGSPEYKMDLLTSPESTNPRPFFPTYLGRAPSPDEVKAFSNALLQGTRDEAIVSALVASIENFKTNGTGATQSAQDQNWLAAAYNAVLGRAPDAQGSQSFQTFLNGAEQAGRNIFSKAVPAGDEYFTKVITDTFIHYLGRLPGSAGISFWLPFLKQPASAGTASPDEQFVASILSSLEFFSDQKDPNGLSTNDSWLASLYSLLLRRQPDPGINTWRDFIDNGYQQQRQAAVSALEASAEYKQLVITSYFKTYLRRAPSAGELNAFASAFESTATDEQVISALVSSTEYFENPNLGAASNSIWLNQVYVDLLHRDRDPGSQGFLDGLNKGTLTRAQVASAILGSAEYRTDLVNLFFGTYLGRPATSAELTQFVPALASGTTDEKILAMILSSTEYLQRQHPYP